MKDTTSRSTKNLEENQSSITDVSPQPQSTDCIDAPTLFLINLLLLIFFLVVFFGINALIKIGLILTAICGLLILILLFNDFLPYFQKFRGK